MKKPLLFLCRFGYHPLGLAVHSARRAKTPCLPPVSQPTLPAFRSLVLP